jgi:iron(III) transport system substrate-binding protein
MKKVPYLGLAALLCILLVLAACAEPTPGTTAALNPTTEAGWSKVVEAAQEEGKVTVYATAFLAAPQTREAISKAFSEEYGITLEWVGGRGAETVARIETEQRTKQYVADVIEAGTTSLWQLREKGYLNRVGALPSLEDLEAFSVSPYFVDPEGYLIGTALVYGGHLVNTDLVKPEEELKSYYDLLDPKWKGKIAMSDVTMPGVGLYWYYGVQKYFADTDYMSRLADQDITFMRGYRDVVDSVAKGEFPIAIGVHYFFAVPHFLAGAPVKVMYFDEGTWTLTGQVSLVSNAPHGNAAKVFVNWLSSAAGQKVWMRSLGIESIRKDVTGTEIPRLYGQRKGKTEIFTLDDIFAIDEAMPMAKEWSGKR